VFRKCLKLSKPLVTSSRPSDQQSRSPTAARVESTARHNEPVSVGGTQTKTRSDFEGWSEMIGEVPRSLNAQTAVRHDVQLERGPFRPGLENWFEKKRSFRFLKNL